jgi:hypothetical protein
MPYRDRTGPEGLGPLTGRGAGFCASPNTPFIRRPAGLFWRVGRRIFNRFTYPGRPRFMRIGRGRNRKII